MTYYVIAVICGAAALGVGWRLVYLWRLRWRLEASLEALLEANKARPRPGMDRPDRRRFEIAGRRES